MSYGYKGERVLLESPSYYSLPYIESTECIQYSRRKQEAAAISHNTLLCISSSELELSTLQLMMTRSMTSDFEHSNLMGVTPQMDRTITLHAGDFIFRWPFCPHQLDPASATNSQAMSFLLGLGKTATEMQVWS